MLLENNEMVYDILLWYKPNCTKNINEVLDFLLHALDLCIKLVN